MSKSSLYSIRELLLSAAPAFGLIVSVSTPWCLLFFFGGTLRAPTDPVPA